MPAQLLSVNVSAARTVELDGAPISTGIYKEPVTGRVAVRGINIAGDDQGNRAVHGGPYRAAYAYADEDYRWWEGELKRPMMPGLFGENLTVRGLDVSGARIGEQWQIGTTLFEVTSPRVPCSRLAMKLADLTIVKTFARALRPGAYLRILTEGMIAADDPIAIVHRPEHALSVARMAEIVLFDHASARELLVPQIPPRWREWVEERAS